MGTIAEKLAYLLGTKAAIRAAIIEKGVDVGDSVTFREYAEKILEIEGGSPSERVIPWSMPILTSGTDQGYIITADSEWHTTAANYRYAWRAFDGVVGDGVNNCWHSLDSTVNNHWIKIDTGRKVCIKNFTQKNITGNYPYLLPDSIKVYGSQYDDTYTLIADCDTTQGRAIGSVHTFSLPNSTFYRFYKFVYSADTLLSNKYYAACGEMVLVGDEKVQITE